MKLIEIIADGWEKYSLKMNSGSFGRFISNRKETADYISDYYLKNTIAATAMLTAITPIRAGIETLIAGMPNDVSINARKIAAIALYGGIAEFIDRSRDKWNDVNKIKNKTLSDVAGTMIYGIASSAIIYYASGCRDLKQMTLATGLDTLTAAPVYTLTLLMSDFFKGLSGLKEMNGAIPDYVCGLNRKSKRTKRNIIAGIVAASLMFTAGEYALSGFMKNRVAYQNSADHSQQASKKNIRNF